MLKSSDVLRVMTVFILSLLALTGCSKKEANGSDEKVEFTGDVDKISYIIGFQIGQDLKNNKVENIRIDRFQKAVKDVLEGKDPELTQNEMATVMQTFVESLKAQQQGTESDADVDYEKVSYIIGFQIGNDFKNNGIEELNTVFLGRGVSDVLDGKESAIAEADMQSIMELYMNEVREKQQVVFQQRQQENREEASAFLAKNASEEGVITLSDSLQYQVITTGTGQKPQADDTVKVHYRGTYLDGTEFDSSYSRNAPAEFPVQGVIVGWQEALKLMNVGSKWKVFIPPELAYGEMGRPGGIPPNKLLVFEMELLEIVEKGESEN